MNVKTAFFGVRLCTYTSFHTVKLKHLTVGTRRKTVLTDLVLHFCNIVRLMMDSLKKDLSEPGITVNDSPVRNLGVVL